MADKTCSLVWTYFDQSSDGMSATFWLCKKTYKKMQGNTRNVAAHLKRDHWKEIQQISQDEQRKTMHASDDPGTPMCLKI